MRWLLLLVPVMALAQDDCRGNSCNVEGGGDVIIDNPVDVETIVSSSVDTSMSSSLSDSSNSFGLGLGDVDINDCYRSYQVVIWQDSKVNKWCMANDLDARGLHDAAAKTRCSLRAYRNIFDSRADCIASSTARPIAVAQMPEPVMEDHFEEEEEFHVAQQMLFEDLRAKIRNLELAQQQEQQRSQRAVQAVQQRDEEQQNYAKELLEELKQWK